MLRMSLVDCRTAPLKGRFYIKYQHDIKRVVWLVVSALMLLSTTLFLTAIASAPLYAQVTANPLYQGNNNSSSSSSSSQAVTSTQTNANGVPNAQQVLSNIADQIPYLTGFVYAIVFIIGLAFIIGGLMKLKHAGEQRSMMSSHGGLGGAVLYLVVGALLLFLPTTMQVATSTFWTTPCSECYPTSSDSGFTSVFEVMYSVIKFVGLIAFVRGLVILSHLGEQSQHGKFAQAMTHIVGGILCMNIGAFIQVVFATLGIKL